MSGREQNKTPTVFTPTEAILESISDGVFTVDLDWRITSFNRAAEEIMTYSTPTCRPCRSASPRPCCEMLKAT